MPKLYLYILYAPTKKGDIWKIGITNRDPADRLKEIQADGRRHNDPTQHAQIYAVFKLYNADKLERRLHHHYSRQQHKGIKGSGGTEWFDLRYPFYALFVCRARRLLELFLYCVLYVLIISLIFHLIKTLCYG